MQAKQSTLGETMKSLEGCDLETPNADKKINCYRFSLPEGPSVRIIVLTHSIIRVTVTFDSKEQVEESYGLVLTAWEDRFDQLMSKYRKKIDPLTNVKFEEKWG